MKIFFTIGDQQLSATLQQSEAARQFAAMLPLKITMFDLFKREKFGLLSDSLVVPTATVRTKRYSVGDIIFWAGGRNLAILYRQDGKVISGAFNVLGRIASGVEVFGQQGPLEVQIDRVALDDKVSHATTAKRLPGRSLHSKLPRPGC